jgi:DtxR family Mn-dependent transcriptional regulator
MIIYGEMLASQTVENYLKAIYMAQRGSSPEHEDEGSTLVPMGQLATALGVVPGTATTMVKTLAESGLVHYEPYMGVRLTGAGERLAALVLRRHRLIEQFLVEVLGMNWSEVHDEAERLEHAVSERLIDRIDEMLGRPAVDPHGDPIPGPEGELALQRYDDLLSCPVSTPLLVTRVTDQDAKFLRFIEERRLKPGERISIVIRDPASDSVTVQSADGRETTIGTRAASKVLVVPA